MRPRNPTKSMLSEIPSPATLFGGQVGMEPNQSILAPFRVGDWLRIVLPMQARQEGRWPTSWMGPNQASKPSFASVETIFGTEDMLTIEKQVLVLQERLARCRVCRAD